VTPTKPRVVLIEDEFLIATMLQDQLEDLGCEVIGPIRTLRDAVEASRSIDADAAVVNLHLNREDATTVVELLLSRKIAVGIASGANDAPVKWNTLPLLRRPYTSSQAREFLLRVLPNHRLPNGN
jgi:DNA-binding NarL/FixJ family response regulator